MNDFGGDWKIVGWALADDVAPRDLCIYVMLFEKNGDRIWCHTSHYTMKRIAAVVRANKSRIAALR